MLDFLRALDPPPAAPPFSWKRSLLFGLAGRRMAGLLSCHCSCALQGRNDQAKSDRCW